LASVSIPRHSSTVHDNLAGHIDLGATPSRQLRQRLDAFQRFRSFVKRLWAHADESPRMLFRTVSPDERTLFMIRKENRMDSFQRQVTALRQQLSSESDDEIIDDAEPMPVTGELQRSPAPITMLDRVSPDQHTQWLGGDPEVGVIAADSNWAGVMYSDGSLRVHGHAEGELHATRSIYVAEGATVSAKLTSNNIVIAGVVDGTVECTGRLEVLPTGRVSGEVSAPTLVVHDGATMTGQLKMRAPAGG